MGQSNAQKQMTQSQISTQQQQNQIAQTAQAESEQDRARRVALEQPAIDKYTALASGDKTEALKASMPVLSQVSQGYAAAKQSIFNSLPPGASRDKAMADLETQKFTTTAGTQAQMVADAPDKLANIGAGLGSMSLQELGAALGANQGAATTASNVVGQQNEMKAQNLQLLGGLAGTAGSVATKIPWSDRRIKQDIEQVYDITDKLGDIDVYSFKYVSSRYDPKELRHIGVMAQDVTRQFPEAVGTDSMAGREYLTVDYGSIAALALGAVKELTARVKALEEQLNRVGV